MIVECLLMCCSNKKIASVHQVRAVQRFCPSSNVPLERAGIRV